MKEKLETIKKQAKERIEESKDLQALNELKVKILVKKGELTEILRGMKDLSPEERPIIGSLVNTVRDEIEGTIESAEELLKQKELEEKLNKEKIDITSPSSKIKRGSKHPINRTIEEIRGFVCINGI